MNLHCELDCTVPMRAISSQFCIFWRGKDISYRIYPHISTRVKSASDGRSDITATLPADKQYITEYKQYALKGSGAFLELIHGKIHKAEVDKVRQPIVNGLRKCHYDRHDRKVMMANIFFLNTVSM